MPDGDFALNLKHWIPFAGMLCGVLLTAIVVAAIYFIVRMKSRARERLAALAIENNQPDVARELVKRNPRWILWIILGIVALTVLSCVNIGWGYVIIAVVAIVTFHIWYPALAGTGEESKSKETPPSPPGASVPPRNAEGQLPRGPEDNPPPQ
ncbi:MAG: hypothetical protein ACYTAN_10840 [Planctomycetota bacterium]|jgi:membrane protein implicated in regulation of membrane protease activity